jgi:NTP pyrophosphatase (non-canonical NTP hydrolase)
VVLGGLKVNYTLEQIRIQVLAAVNAERDRQNKLWGLQRHSLGKWLGILTEEFGEVGQAINRIHFPDDAKPTDADDLYKELIHVAAVASAMAEQLKEEKTRRFID